MKLLYKQITPLLLIPITFMVLASCKKTIDLEPLPQAKILTYKVTNIPDTVIYGAVDDLEGTITVYLPYYYGLSIIDPEITVASGSKLDEEILPVNVTDTKTYGVTGNDGSKKIYTLKLIQQNPTNLSFRWNTANPIAYPGAVLPIMLGDFMQRNPALVEVVVSERVSKKATTLVLNASTAIRAETLNYALINMPLPATLDTGSYTVSINTLGTKMDLPEVLRIRHRQPNLLMPTQAAKQGGSIIYVPFNSIFINVKKVSVTVNTVVYELPVVTYSPLSLELRIPDDFPIGVWQIPFKFEFEGWTTLTKSGNLTVTAK
ncbi:hypothetical protein [Pedobacter metabolipauper]|uniref:DUF5018 domain-containing protein n=1 Tax=Pedobacter metabolipauper TaxID=425513 RepID=A0A4R6ST87_9SPHI|nr:hypothetical protein [Pedobacter metabolipauper]TDQ06714.1 hypothetical protein ATK78_4373 [Pedobacter metabolipauper]